MRKEMAQFFADFFGKFLEKDLLKSGKAWLTGWWGVSGFW
jgi:hypothetical protein